MSVSLCSMLRNIGVTKPVNIPRSFHAFPRNGSLRAAIKAMEDVDIDRWEMTSESQFHNYEWSDEFQGLTHDDQHWYISRTFNISKHNSYFEKIHEIGIPSDLEKEGYNHFGDIDFYNGHLYIPIEHENWERDPIVLVLDSNLVEIEHKALSKHRAAPWCAINPWNGYLYSSEFHNVSKLYAYDPENDFEFITTLELKNPDGVIDEVQGGCFSKNGRLYLTSDITQEIRCYSVLNGCFMGSRKVLYNPDSPDYFEMEGITLWRLIVDSAPVQIHVGIRDNDWPDKDDLYLKHYSSSSPVMI